ncbi:hypothetical protein CPT_Shady_065 [Streptomyces phage Shady]|uniref:Uncharacterized protein n=1 Tax=Streptomyces phage Shady TaxID=2767585 RepID=A0A873WK01_9CAUD|nr:hypothetical protein CPT_Shady_065 [Streptomyces phage Shady]
MTAADRMNVRGMSLYGWGVRDCSREPYSHLPHARRGGVRV